MSTSSPPEKGLKDIPGPWPSIPLLGTGWQYLPGSRYDLSKLHEASEDKFRRFGPIVKEEFQWGQPVVQLFDPKDFETVFKTQGQYPLRPLQDFLTHYRKSKPEKYDSSGLANEEGEEWEKLRKVIGPILLKPKAINFLMDSMNEIGDDFASLMRSERDPDSLVIADVQEISYKLALEGVYMMSLDTRLGCFDPDLPEEGSSASDMIMSVKLLFEAFQELYFGLPLWKYIETASYKKLDKAESLMYSATSKQIRESVERLRNFDAGDDEKVGVLQMLIQSGQLSDKELVVSVIDLISGGIFTVANSLSFLLYHISKNPDVQEKLYQEVMQEMPDSVVTNTRLGKMPYLKACVKEAFRLTPTIPAISRILPTDTVLSGYKVPAGTTVFCNFPVPCMQEKFFPDPHSFRPDRWLTGNPSPYLLMPFGLGARMCVGKRFAEMEMNVALAKIVYNFKIEHTGEDIECKSAFILVPSNPVSLVLKDR